MHPYRESPMRAARRAQVDTEDLVLYGLLVVIGLIPVVIALVDRAAFGFDATLGLMMVVIGLVGWVVQLARARWTRRA